MMPVNRFAYFKGQPYREYRKIVDVAQLLPDLQEKFGDIQFCGASFRIERTQNAINVHLSGNPHLSYSSSDNADAYSNSERGPILSRVCRPSSFLFNGVSLQYRM
jgi:hypothetical protein